MRDAQPATARVSPSGWLRFMLRLSAMATLLLVCVPLFLLWRLPWMTLAWPHNPWPRLFLGGVARLSGVRVRTIGERGQGGAFLLANHVSWIDIPAIAGATGAAFVAHDGLASVPLLRWLCAMNDTVFVARHDRKSVAAQVEAVREAIRDTGALAIFPEGTTSDGKSLLPFKSSLLSALDPVPPGIVVQPVWLDYGTEATDIAWVGDEHGFANFRRILARGRRVSLAIHFLDPLGAEALASRKTMAAAAREAIERARQRVAL